MNSKQITKDTANATKDTIKELMKRYNNAANEAAREDIALEINEYPLEIQINYGWHQAGNLPDSPVEYKLVLTTGGPHVELVGSLDVDGYPKDAKLVAHSHGKKHTIHHHNCEELLELAEYFNYVV